MHKVWRALGIIQQIVEQLSIMRHGVAMRRARVVPVKHGMAALVLALKEVEIKAEARPVHMQKRHTESQQPKYKKKTPTLVVHAVQINKTTTLPIPTEE